MVSMDTVSLHLSIPNETNTPNRQRRCCVFAFALPPYTTHVVELDFFFLFSFTHVSGFTAGQERVLANGFGLMSVSDVKTQQRAKQNNKSKRNKK